MVSGLLKKKTVVYALMTFLVFAWGFDYIVAKTALSVLEPLTLVFFKYFIGATVLGIARAWKGKKFPMKKKDIKLFICCSIFGQMLYFLCEYSALDYLPVSTITIVLAFVPMLSIMIETVLSRKLPSAIIVIGILIGIIGVAMVIGVDLSAFRTGKGLGYLLVFGAVVFWNIYNFLTAKLSGKYETFDLAFLQLFCSALVILPIAVCNLPAAEEISIRLILEILYLGIVNASVGFSIYVISVSVIGPTPSSIFSNFIPLTAAFFGWIFLEEIITPLQMCGGAIVVASGATVIWQKGKAEKGQRL